MGGLPFATEGTVADLNTDGIPDLILQTSIDIASGGRDGVPRLYFVDGQRVSSPIASVPWYRSWSRDGSRFFHGADTRAGGPASVPWFVPA